MAMHEIPDALVNPPPEFGVTPFWFWNDALDTAEINPSPPGPSETTARNQSSYQSSIAGAMKPACPA